MNALRIVVLGLSLSSSWGNGHATTYRALLKPLAERGHDILFLERERPWYQENQDLHEPSWCQLAWYHSLAGLQAWSNDIAQADVVIVGSYVPEGLAVGGLVQRVARGITAFYDIDTPVTLAALSRGDCSYLSPGLVPGYDIYLSFTGGPTLALLEKHYGARAARALYCSADTELYRPLSVKKRWDLSYLGTYSPDRQPTLERMLLETARRLPHKHFVIGGPQYPDAISWPANVERMEHVGPQDHPAFFAASRWTLNVTRTDMIEAGYSPSVRLFEAAACSAAIISDRWKGIDSIFTDGESIMLADTTEEVVSILERRQPEPVGAAARGVILEGHSAKHRANELEAHLREAAAAKRHAPRLAAGHR